MLDDTCYFLNFNNLKKALIVLFLLKSEEVKSFLNLITLISSKRPYTKEVLMRIDLFKLRNHLSDLKKINFMIDKLTLSEYKIEKNDILLLKNDLEKSNF